METNPQETIKQEHGVGPIAGVVIIVTIMLLGAIYFLLTEVDKQGPEPTNEQAAER